MEEAWPDAPPESSLPSSCIVGLIHISEQRRPADCEHQKVWAAGPICHIIDEAIELSQPIPCRGERGLWQLPPAARLEMLRQLPQSQHLRFTAEKMRRKLYTKRLHDVRGRVLRRITVELFWTQPVTYRETMDATCIAMTADGLVEVVNARGVHGAYYGVDQSSYRIQSKGVDALFGAVAHLGTERSEGSDMQGSLDGKMMCKQMMQVRLDLLPERVTDLFFVLAATNSRELGKFTQLGFRVVDSDIGATLAVEEEHRSQLTFEAVVIMCAIYKLGDGYWRIGSMNVTCSGSPRDLKAALSKLEQLGFPRKHETSSQEHLVVESVRRYLELPRSSVKAANVNIDSSNTMTIQYAIEVLETDDVDATYRGEELKERLSNGLHDAILEEMFKFTNEKVKPERLRVLPVITKSLSHLFIEVKWEFGEVKRTDNKDHSYLDGALVTFAGRSLQEGTGLGVVIGVIVTCSLLWLAMAADPTAEELAAMVDVKAVMTWAGFDVTNMAEDTLPGSLLKHMGLTPTNQPRIVGVFSDNDLQAMIAAWKVPDTTAGNVRAPNLAELGKAKLFCRACQLVAGTGLSLAELKAQTTAAPSTAAAPQGTGATSSASQRRKVKLSSILSQIDDSEILVAEEKEILKCYQRYETVFGSGERPPKDCEPTAEQLSGLIHVMSVGQPPYTDFSVFGPFGHRMMKRIKLSGCNIERDGSLRTVELYGPPNFGAWLQSYNVLLTALVMVDAVDLGHLQTYRAHVERMAERYGPRVWSIVYQADVRCRLEQMERLKRKLVAENEAAVAAGGSTDYDEKRPWNAVWARATADESFWREEVNEPCMLILTKITTPGEVLDGDARVQAPAASAAGPRETTPVLARMTNERQVDESTTAEQQDDGSPENLVDDVTATEGDAIRILYLYSGPHRPDDGLAHFAAELGSDCTCVDKEFDDEQDLLCQSYWEDLRKTFREYDSALMSPPCSSFTPARRGLGGPRPLRGTVGRERYGFKNLTPQEKKTVTEGTIMAIRAADTAEEFDDSDGWWMIEQPHGREGQTSMWNLDEMQKLRDKPGVRLYTFAQCRYGCKAEKLTDLLSNIPGLEEFTVLCNHPKQTWIMPWSGERIWAAHPPLRGRQWAIPESEWDPSMLRDSEPPGDYITRSCAAYPEALNKALAKALSRKKGSMAEHQVHQEKKSEVEDVKVKKLMPLRGEEPDDTNTGDKNSLRDVHKWVTPKSRYIGGQVSNLICRHFDKDPEIEKDILDSLGHRSNENIMDASWMKSLRADIADLLVRNRTATMPDQCDVSVVNTPDYQTCIRGKMLHYWTMVVDDPGQSCATWTFEGAPAGLEMDTSELDGVFQTVEPDEVEPLSMLTTDFEEFSNYDGVEDDQEAYETLEGYCHKGFLRKMSTLEEVRHFVGGEPVLSKLGCIKKAKLNLDTGEVNYKSRIILDCKRSLVSRAAQRKHKAVLPRISDAVHSILSSMSSGEEVTMLVADVTDAFWLIPLHVRERKYFVAKLRGQFYVFTRTAQGSRGAPLTWAAVLSTAARWVASSSPRMKLQVYVDDPLAVLKGNAREQQRMACVVITMWSVMGFPIATHKAVLSSSLVWIGVRLQIQPDQVEAEVPASKVKELDMLLTEVMTSNVISKKSLRTVIGKAMAIASVLFVWRPFISELYVALHADQTHAPNGCIWTKQIAHSVQWLRTFLAGEQAGIIRTYSLDAFNSRGPEIVITWDASPYGMGGTLQVQGTYVEFFACQISKDDEYHLSTQSGTHEGQQTWEGLCGLVCLRLWRSYWQNAKVKLKLRNDNIGALVLFAQVKGKSPAHTLLAREFSLDLGRAQFRPSVAEHLPGAVNLICDALSRRFQPGYDFKLPIQLVRAKAVVPPPRPTAWWKSLAWAAKSPAPPSAMKMGDTPIAPVPEQSKRRRKS
eukprot:s446_g18.t1